jgi:PKD repeat protein
VKLTVTDNSGTATAQDTDNTTIEINGPPAVDIGGDFQKTCPDIPTQFDATASTDPNGDDLTYTWDFGDGAKGEGPLVEHTYARPGRFILNATANDGRGLPCSNNTASKVVVVNSLPLSDAGPDQHVNPSEDVVFNGGGSVDPDGSITKYMWDFGDGATAEGSTVKHAYPKPGKYNVTLTVEDDSGLSCNNATDEAVIRVNAPPVADAGPDQIDICSRTVQFDGKGSKDPDGNITVYEWDFGDGSPVGNGSSPTHTYLKPGTYTVTLKVTDDSELESGKDTDVMQVVINDPPIAQINGSNIVCPGGTATFNGKGSTDSDGTIVEYKWDFGDGSSSKTGKNVNHVYDEPGTYKVTLTVKDDSDSKCNTGSVQHEIRVNSAPIAEAGDDITTCVQTTDCSVTLEASKSQDPDGDYLTYYWDLGDGTTRKGIRIQHEYENPGVYTVTLTVVDDSGTVCNEATDTLEITANAPPEVEFGEGGN